MASPAASLSGRLDLALIADAQRLRGRIERARARHAQPAEWERIAADLARSIAQREARVAAKPAISFPPDLPVSQRRAEIADAIRAHPVVIVCGETGSGKTTQLPKICLLAGRGERGLIGHTQPRRIAARTVASRIAHELGTPLGEAVGYKVRFSDHTRREAYIKLMTDGILLAETQGDRGLSAYDTIIVDEAHERSLNIDFLLGYLKRLVERRPELRLVITSATLDAQRFAAHFGSAHRNAPVIEVSGRLYPVEVRYRPLGSGNAEDADDEEELEEAIVAAVEELWRERSGDILVFLPGEREIRETGELLRRGLARRPYGNAVEILPLYARLSVQEQERAFAPSNGRRIVLATNVAETSLTVPGIRYVIDPGLARIKRYSVRNKTTLLQIEKVSQAATDQRAGRCGRVQNGVCVRLFSEDDFAARPKYTDPEILRSSLASVILRMAALDLGPVDQFPFVESPSPRAIADGYQLLQELSAIDAARSLTPLGRELARLPLDPRIGRIVLAARDGGCLPEALVIASALAVPDARERPLERQQAADQAHLRFRDERSDFLSLVALWEFFADLLGQGLGHRALVDACRAQFINSLRMREWKDVHRQLAGELAEAGWQWDKALPKSTNAERYMAIHKALLAGLLGNVGTKDEPGDGYLGTRGLRFFLHPGSGLAKKGPRWVLAAELVETTRLFARCAARVEPEWIEAVAGTIVARDYFEPQWDEVRGEVVASERVQLYGLTLVQRRLVSFGRIDPALAREVFIREALVTGRLQTRGAFLAHNRKLVAEVAELENKARRQDVLVDDEAIAAFYAERLPQAVSSIAGFERWREEAERADPRILCMTREALMRHGAAAVTEAQFPEVLELAGARLPLKYRFAPGHPRDGLTLTVPLALLNQIDVAQLSWLVPGMIREKVGWYLKTLPKALRNRLIPMPEVVTAFLSWNGAQGLDLPDAIRAYLKERLGEALPADLWEGQLPPEHLRVAVRVVDAAGDELASDRDLGRLREQLGEAAQMSFASGGSAFERRGLRAWDVGELPISLAVARKGQRVTGYPAMVDDGDSVSLAMLDTADAAAASHRLGVIRLVRIALAPMLEGLEKGRGAGGPAFGEAAARLKAVIPPDRLLADVMAAVRDRAFVGDDPLPRNKAAFDEQVKRARARLPAVADGGFRLLAEIAAEHQALTQRIATLPSSLSRFAADLRTQRDALVFPGFVGATPWAQLQHLPRYLRALLRRLAKFQENPERDARHAPKIMALTQRYRERRERDGRLGRRDPALEAFRWLLEELKVSLFAQELKTPCPVSYKRVEKAWSDLSG